MLKMNYFVGSVDTGPYFRQKLYKDQNGKNGFYLKRFKTEQKMLLNCLSVEGNECIFMFWSEITISGLAHLISIVF